MPHQMRDALLELNLVPLSRVQVYTVMGEAVQDAAGRVQYRQLRSRRRLTSVAALSCNTVFLICFFRYFNFKSKTRTRFAKIAAALIAHMCDPAQISARREMMARSALLPVDLLNGLDRAELQVRRLLSFSV